VPQFEKSIFAKEKLIKWRSSTVINATFISGYNYNHAQSHLQGGKTSAETEQHKLRSHCQKGPSHHPVITLADH
jgi:hypothetical protein